MRTATGGPSRKGGVVDDHNGFEAEGFFRHNRMFFVIVRFH